MPGSGWASPLLDLLGMLTVGAAAKPCYQVGPTSNVGELRPHLAQAGLGAPAAEGDDSRVSAHMTMPPASRVARDIGASYADLPPRGRPADEAPGECLRELDGAHCLDMG
jgi:hypothetical protein